MRALEALGMGGDCELCELRCAALVGRGIGSEVPTISKGGVLLARYCKNNKPVHAIDIRYSYSESLFAIAIAIAIARL